MHDPIPPPAARQPEEALELLSQAISDGDLEAALAQYEKTAPISAWPEVAAKPAADAGRDVRSMLLSLMALRIPLAVRIDTVLRTPDLALVVCERCIRGTGPDGEPVWLCGLGCVVLRPQPDGAWRIAADAWRVG